jgi:hypothetical protein
MTPPSQYALCARRLSAFGGERCASGRWCVDGFGLRSGEVCPFSGRPRPGQAAARTACKWRTYGCLSDCPGIQLLFATSFRARQPGTSHRTRTKPPRSQTQLGVVCAAILAYPSWNFSMMGKAANDRNGSKRDYAASARMSALRRFSCREKSDRRPPIDVAPITLLGVMARSASGLPRVAWGPQSRRERRCLWSNPKLNPVGEFISTALVRQ